MKQHTVLQSMILFFMFSAAHAYADAPQISIQSNCASGDKQCFNSGTSAQGVASSDMRITLKDGTTKTLTNASISFDWLKGGSYGTKASLTNVIITDKSVSKSYSLSSGDITDFSFNDAKACFGFVKTTAWYGSVSSYYMSTKLATIQAATGTSGSTACSGKIAVGKDGYFQVSTNYGNSSYYPLTLSKY